MNNQTNVFIKIVRFVDGNSKKNSKLAYYKEGYYLKYITRDNACCKHNLTNEELVALKDKYQNPKYYYKELKKMAAKEDNTGIWSEQGQLNKNEEDTLQGKIKNLNPKQLFWDTVISFDQDFANQYQLFTPSKMQELVKANINKFFIDNNMQPKNMEWFFTFHTNTDNPHVHLAFFEKAPKMYNKKTKSYEYRHKGAIPISACKKQAFKIESYLAKTVDYQKLQNDRNQVVKAFKLVWVDVKQIYTDLKNVNADVQIRLQEIVKLLNFKKGRINYQKPFYYQQSPTIKSKLDAFSSLLIKQNPILKEKYQQFIETISHYQGLLNTKGKAYETKIKTKNNIVTKTKLPWETFLQEQLYGTDGLFSRVGNEILKTIKQLPKYQKPFVPLLPKHKQASSYLKINLIDKMLRQIEQQFGQIQKQAEYQFKKLQASQIYELRKSL